MDEHQQMVDDCIKREGKLSDWERQFIDSISDQLARGKSLTPRQDETLTNIWNKIT